MEQRTWFHGKAKSKILQEEEMRKNKDKKKKRELMLREKRKKAYGEWIKKSHRLS